MLRRPCIGAGWWGKGKPLLIEKDLKIREYNDGAGLCSPGRWRPEDRNLPDTVDLTLVLVKQLIAWEERTKPKMLEILCYQMMCNKLV